jgi:hypothetical protein
LERFLIIGLAEEMNCEGYYTDYTIQPQGNHKLLSLALLYQPLAQKDDQDRLPLHNRHLKKNKLFPREVY